MREYQDALVEYAEAQVRGRSCWPPRVGAQGWKARATRRRVVGRAGLLCHVPAVDMNVCLSDAGRRSPTRLVLVLLFLLMVVDYAARHVLARFRPSGGRPRWVCSRRVRGWASGSAGLAGFWARRSGGGVRRSGSGLAIGPVLTGALARWGLGSALSVVVGLGVPAALALYGGSRSSRRDRNQAASPPPGRRRERAGAGSDSSEPTGALDVDAGDAAGRSSTRAQPLPTHGITPGDAAPGAPPRPAISPREG